MSSEEQAKQVREKAHLIQNVAHQIMNLCDRVLDRYPIGDETLGLTGDQAQKAIQHYRQKLKPQLQSLVEELP